MKSVVNTGCGNGFTVTASDGVPITVPETSYKVTPTEPEPTALQPILTVPVPVLTI